MMGDDRLLTLIDRLYGAAAGSSLWKHVVADIARIFDGDMTALILVNPATGTAKRVDVFGLDEAPIRDYEQHYSAISPTSRMTRMMPVSQVFTDAMYPEQRALRRSEFYNDWAQPLRLETLIGVNALKSERRMGQIIIRRDERRGSFDEAAQATMARLAPHFRRAMQVWDRLEAARTITASLETALEAAPYGIVILDTLGKVRFMNRIALEITAAEDGLTAGKNGLCATRMSDNTALQRAIRNAIGTATHRDIEAGGTLAVERPSGRRPYAVLVSPAARQANDFGDAAAATIFITDPERAPHPPKDMLCRQFGLTPKEAALAGFLAMGLSLDEAAARLKITKETARSHLQRVFSKTGTHRQAELVRLVLANPAFANSH